MKLKTAANRAKNFVVDHKVALSVGATIVVCAVIQQATVRQHNEFLAEHGLLEKFYEIAEEV